MPSLSATPLGPANGFNWVYLVELLVCGILALFFLFYFNRLFATLVSYGIRAWTWHKYRAHIDITALQISLLGGRIFFKGIRYHAHNVTVLVHDGHVTWRYWLRQVQEAEVFEVEDNGRTRRQRASSSAERQESDSKSSSDEKPRSSSVGKAEKGGTKPKKELPCRISVKVAAVEAFIYNHSPAYDILVDAALRKDKHTQGSSDRNEKFGAVPESSSSNENDEKRDTTFGNDAEKTDRHDTNGASSFGPQNSHSNYEKPEVPSWLRILPVRIECKRAAGAVGNENTTSVITAKMERAVGTIDAGHAGPLDLYKLLFSFDFEKVHVAMKPNRDFKQLQLDSAKRVLREKENEPPPSKGWLRRPLFAIRQKYDTLTSHPKRRKSTTGSLRTTSMKSVVEDLHTIVSDQVPGQAQWHGLARYLDDTEHDERDEWQDVEYAKSSTLVECDKINFRFYFDMPGRVLDGRSDTETLLDSEYEGDINGSKPPDYGLDFGVHGGNVVYGPWADRQRVILQHVFFPASCVNSVPATPLKPGDTRVWTVFKIFVAVEEDVTLRIPTREPSKDDQWTGRADDSKPGPGHEGDDGKTKGKRGRRQKHRHRKGKQGTPAIDARPYGWLDITVKKDSIVNYVMDMYPRANGFQNSLDLDVKGTEMTSSVNHGLLWRAGPLTLDADLSYPLTWNSLRKWPFNIVCDDLELFILRDHMFLIMDIVNDWSAGPPPDFYTFVPFFYNLDLLFRNFTMYLNVNDANIVNDPADLEKNDFLTLEGRDLHGVIGIPLEFYRPKRNEITFEVLALDMKMRILSPSRSTFNTLLHDKEIAKLPKLTLKGSFDQNGETMPGLTDVLRFDIVGTGLNLKAFGFVMRQFINVKENYFGDYIHFKTLEEFQHAGDNFAEANANTASLPHPSTVNELDVILCIVAEEATVMVPTNMYSANEFVCIELPVANLDLRITSYYLDMGLNLSPLSFLSGSLTSNEEDSPVADASKTQILVSHVDLNGHRAFGLPPNEPAYVATWDIDIGRLTGECSGGFLHDLALAAKCFIFTFSDGENALPVFSPNVFYDISFVQVRTDIIRLWMHAGKEAILLSAQPINVDTNDWAGDRFSQRVTVLAPEITVACVDGRNASRNRTQETRRLPVRTYAFLQTGVALDVVGRKLHFAEDRSAQQAHVRQCDERTGRAPFLQRSKADLPATYVGEAAPQPPAMPYPSFPFPIDLAGRDVRRPSSIKSVQSFISKRSLGRKESSSSLRASIRGSGPMFKSLRRPSNEKRTRSSQTIASSSASSFSGSLPLRAGGLLGGRETLSYGLPPSTIAFSSNFSEPHFPLDTVEPDESDVPTFPTIGDHSETTSVVSSSSEAIGDPEIDDEAEHTTIFIKLVPGIRAYVEPRVGAVAAKLMQKLMPKYAEDVMDDFQFNVMSSITNRQQQRHGKNTILEIQADLPSAHLRVANPSGQDEARLDIVVHSLEQSVRVKDLPSSSGLKEVLALRTVADRLVLSLNERKATTDAALRVTVDDILVWVALASTKSIHVSVRDTSIFAAGDQANGLAQLALKVLPVADELKSRFEDLFEMERKRLLLLVLALTQHSEGVADPQFLSRMTYILRAFPEHYRNQESWKIIARFRHILQSMPANVRKDLNSKFKSGELDFHADNPTKAVEDWAQYRNWDVPNVNQTLAFRMLVSQAEAQPLEKPEAPPLTLTVRSEMLKVSVGHAAKVSEVVIEETSVGLDSTPPTVPTGLMVVEENERTKTMMQIHTTTIGFSFDWSIFGVVESVLPLVPEFQKFTLVESQNPHASTAGVLEAGLNRHDFHVVLSTDNGSIKLQTINLRHLSRAEGLKMSLIGTTYGGERFHDGHRWGQCASAMVNVDKAVTELHGPSSCVWQTLLISPSLYVDHLQPAEGYDGPPSVTLAVACRDLELAVKEQVPGILHIIDGVILDEVANVLHLVNSLKQDQPTEQQVHPVASTPQQAPRISVAVLAGNLHVEVSLLQSLSYHLEGSATSVRVAPSLSQKGLLSIDFDIGRQSHSFVNLTRRERHHQGLFHLPPINGHVGLQTSTEETSVSAVGTVEKIEVDAAAIQGIIGVVNKPQVQDVFSAIMGGVEDIKDHVANLVPAAPAPTPKAVSQDQRICYDVRFALLGIRVSASTPQMQKRSMAHFEFGIGPLHATASNKASVTGANPLIPEVRAQIQNIGARLWTEERDGQHPCGNVTLAIKVHFHSYTSDSGDIARALVLRSEGLEINAYPETASTVTDVINHMQDRIRDLDLSKEVEYLRRLRDSRRDEVIQKIRGKPKSSLDDEEVAFSAEDLLAVQTTIELSNIQVSWLVAEQFAPTSRTKPEDAVLTLSSIQFTTRGGHEARLTIQDLMLQLVQHNASRKQRSLNSALLPEIGFSVAYWSEGKSRSLAFKATGKPLDLRLESTFIVPVNAVQRSVEFAVEKFKTGTATWQSTPTSTGAPRAPMFDTKRLASLLVEADFAGAQVYMQGTGTPDKTLGGMAAASQQEHRAQHGRYGQFATEGHHMHSTLRAPGIALKLEYNNNEHHPSVKGELRIDASSNMLLPNVVPLLLEVSDSVKDVVQNQRDTAPAEPKPEASNKPAQRFFEEDSLITANPTAIFGKTKVDLGLRICRQEFGLTCQPIARVDAKAALDDFYFTMNTIESDDYGHFFAMSATVTKLTAHVKHVYSREPTFSYDMDSIVLSLMNSKHLSGTNGVSAIVKINPIRLSVNGKQLQDLLLFREIWLPPEIRNAQSSPPPPTSTAPVSSTRPDDFFAQRYHTVAAAAAFPWNATVSIAKLGVDLDLGQSIGKTSFTITNLWASQQKSSNREQNLCIGLENMEMASTGRMSGFIQLAGVGVRTSIQWPEDSKTERLTPLIQASIGFSKLRAKAAFDYQAFAFGDIEDFDFLMYNVRETGRSSRNQDRLVAVLDCQKAFVFCTSTSSAQAVGLFQAFDRLIQEKQAAYKQSLKDIEKHLRRESTVVPTRFGPQVPAIQASPVQSPSRNESPISLHTDVVLTLGTISFGVYPSTFFDSQLLKLEANNIQGRFAVGLERGRIHSALGITLGQLQVALAPVRRMTAVPKALEISVDEVISSATNAKGGTILRVPKVVASMQTWQPPNENKVDYIFKSLFEGKIDVGWNLSRINFIKGMWTAHSRSLASRLGKALPASAVKITAGPQDRGEKMVGNQQEKITAEVNLPQSRYEYKALEPPVIETPQLRDMGEATPPLEWIGLHRDRLPNVTHQIIIVSLLEVAKEVEDAYERILGTS